MARLRTVSRAGRPGAGKVWGEQQTWPRTDTRPPPVKAEVAVALLRLVLGGTDIEGDWKRIFREKRGTTFADSPPRLLAEARNPENPTPRSPSAWPQREEADG